jgi:Ca2+-binding EF-hand superfamily protein
MTATARARLRHLVDEPGTSPKKTMRTVLTCVLLTSTSLWAAQPAEPLDPATFEKRFHLADTDKDGRLSRQEAYAEFPRMPQFFDEIDSNRDDAITLPEVNQALERRLDAAMKATTQLDASAMGTTGPAAGQAPFDELATRRAVREQYYESLTEDKARARELGEVVPRSPSAPLFDKQY